MLLRKKIVLLSFTMVFFTFLNAQIEVSHLTSKGYSSTGFGGFLNFAIHDDDGVLLVPVLLGYRYTFNGSGTGLYIEPTAGYTIGATDIQKIDEAGFPVIADGKYAEQKASGVTAGAGTGYIFPGRVAFNIGLRYQHVFVSKDPGLNLFSLRISHTISLRRRD